MSDKEDLEDIDINADVLDFGIDSITVSTVATDIQEKYNFEIDPKLFFQAEDLEELLISLWEQNQETILKDYSL